MFERWFADLFDELFGPCRRGEKETDTMTVPLRAVLYLRVSTARQAEHDVSIPDQKRQGEAYCTARGDQLVETYVEPGASKPAPFRRGGRSLVQPRLPRCLRHGVPRQEAGEERRQAAVNHPGDWRRSGASDDATDHGAVRRIPVQGKRQARHTGLEGERPARLLERRASAHRLSCHRGRAAQGQDQEEAGDRPAPRRPGPGALEGSQPQGHPFRRHQRADHADRASIAPSAAGP